VIIRRLDLRGKRLSTSEYKSLLPRASLDIESALISVTPILEAVKNGTEDTLKEFALRFDGITPDSIRVPRTALKSALNELNPEVRAALVEAIERIKKVHSDQVRSEKETRVVDGGVVTSRWIPVDRVGLYVPGGNAVYPSSVMMNVIPAQIAKVPSIAVASPPQKDFGGLPHPTILATCELLGIDEVYAVGGAQGIAMFAYGVAGLCEPTNIVTGPGNIYVAAAKRALRGLIGIDSEAGPTEIAIVADKTARPKDVAADLISQAEHDTIAAALLITDSQELIDQVEAELEVRVSKTKHSERIRTALGGVQSCIVLVDNMDQGLDVVNAYAAEHLEIIAADARALALKVRNAGAVFIGEYSPVSLGDYSAGSNHVLPTGGCACHSSGLSVQTFLRGVNFIEYDEKSFKEIAQNVITLANSEDLPAHGEAMKARFE
jgi:histidinol dehydrogenase